MKTTLIPQMLKAAALVVSALMVSCTAVGPTYEAPRPEMPAGWIDGATGSRSQADAVVSQWWTLFEDPELNTLIQRSLSANQDLRIAETRIREARAVRRIASAAALPSVNSSASALKSQSYENTSGGARKGELYQASFDASWEIDIFGGIRRMGEAAEAVVASTIEDKRDVQITLMAEVARNYLELRGGQQRLMIARENIANQEKTVEMMLKRNELGMGSELALEQAKNQLYVTKSYVPGFESVVRQSMVQLALLVGQPPQSLVKELSVEGSIPAVQTNLPAIIPSELLRRRPDIRRAERQLAAATAEIGVATADLFPRFSLGALAGLESADLSDLVTSGSRFWTFGPSIKWSLFDGGRTRAAIEVRNVQRDRAQIVYEKTVLAALTETEGALVAFSREQETRRSLKAAVEAGERAVILAKSQYAIGLADFLNVLVSEYSIRQTQDQLVQSEQRLALNMVFLFKALGGGWALPKDPP
jgi:NodT family efflux transporter outer membrane factor (OMF) lipoprotein